MASPSLDVGSRAALTSEYRRIRGFTASLAAPLAPEDCVVQSMADVSPTKWHLAHITWFFERFVLAAHLPGYTLYNEAYDHLFNSYYHTAGTMHARPRRGLLSRPTLNEVFAYREAVDDAMLDLIATNNDPQIEFLVSLGLNHEQQHQELLLTDIKHVLAQNPMQPAYNADLPTAPSHPAQELSFVPFSGGMHTIGVKPDDGFCFDNETPRHEVLLQPFALGSRLVSNADYQAFIADGGYEDCALWLADGWTEILAGTLARPLYWSEDLQAEYTLGGLRDIDLSAPVTHLSFFEADAYARWADARLPSEAEWEVAAAAQDTPLRDGNFVDAGYLHPVASTQAGLSQLFGDVWEWTHSSYSAYPGFTPLAGSLGEYNGKFMVSQQVVRGGSCASSADHLRASYRSFFYPASRWQFLGLRLAKTL